MKFGSLFLWTSRKVNSNKCKYTDELRTGNVKRKRISRNISSKRHFKTFRGQERLEDVAHDVYLVFLAVLELLPDDGVVEHVEVVRLELTEHFQRLTVIDNKHLAF